MAYERPTLDRFRALFPAFSALTQEQFDAWAEKAEGRVGTAYGDSQQDATELLTAHYLALNGVGVSGAASIAGTGVTSFKSGSFSMSVSDTAASARAKGGYGATGYGLQFQEIQRRLFGGPRLIGPVHVGCW